MLILTNDVPELLKQFRVMLSEHRDILGKLLVDPRFDFPRDVPAAVLVAFRSREHPPIIPQHRQPAFAPETVMRRPDDHWFDTQTTRWYIHAYLHADDPDVLPLDQTTLGGLQFGGQRNYGYGRTQLKDTQLIELDALDYSRLRDREAYTLTFVTPFVLRSEYPSTNDVDVPWWWAVDEEATLRHREERIVEGADVFRCETVDHGQVVGYSGDRPLETAKTAITRVGSHSKYGFGEIRARPITDHHQRGGRALASVERGEVS